MFRWFILGVLKGLCSVWFWGQSVPGDQLFYFMWDRCSFCITYGPIPCCGTHGSIGFRAVLLPQFPKCWHYSCKPLYPAVVSLKEAEGKTDFLGQNSAFVNFSKFCPFYPISWLLAGLPSKHPASKKIKRKKVKSQTIPALSTTCPWLADGHPQF